MEGKILIIEDERLVAEHLAAILEQAGYSRPLLTDNLAEAQQLFSREFISLIISDIHLQDCPVTGIGIVRQLQNQRNVPVIYLTAFSHEEVVDEALQTEPAAYVLKPFTDRQLLVAVRMAHRVGEAEVGAENYHKPSARELEIVQFLAAGLSSKKIGERLFISEHTVSTHRRNLLKRYHLESSSELITLSIKQKWIKI